MREVKFRGYEPLTKKWAYGYYHPSEGYQVIFDIERSTPSRPYPAIVMYESIGQYTGLKDKNGVEIYEGDILTSEEYPYQDEGVYNYHGVVEYAEEIAAFVSVKRVVNPLKSGISDGISDYFEEVDTFEVIGNTYENPTLLK